MNTHLAKIRVWDLPTRLFHWTLVVCVVGAFISVKLGGLWMDWHMRLGLCTLGLIVFRLIWGFTGPHYARFTQFVGGPRSVWRYIKAKSNHTAGHNPLGAYSVMLLLACFGFQAVSGLFANDDVLSSGPLAFLSEDWSSVLTRLHKLNQWLMIALVAVHVLAILWYRYARHKDLVGPMIHGNIRVPSDLQPVESTQDSWAIRLKAALLAAVISAGLWWLTTLAPTSESFY